MNAKTLIVIIVISCVFCVLYINLQKRSVVTGNSYSFEYDDIIKVTNPSGNPNSARFDVNSTNLPLAYFIRTFADAYGYVTGRRIEQIIFEQIDEPRLMRCSVNITNVPYSRILESLSEELKMNVKWYNNTIKLSPSFSEPVPEETPKSPNEKAPAQADRQEKSP